MQDDRQSFYTQWSKADLECFMPKAVKKTAKKKPVAKTGASDARARAGDKAASAHIDARIRELGDWRGAMLKHVRAIIRAADPGIVETWKWRGVPVWEQGGIICTGETYKAVVKLTFAKGASLDDPAGLFNASLDGRVRRAIDLREGETVDADALAGLVRAAVALNLRR